MWLTSYSTWHNTNITLVGDQAAFSKDSPKTTASL
jgi:hypothetical protein